MAFSQIRNVLLYYIQINLDMDKHFKLILKLKENTNLSRADCSKS